MNAASLIEYHASKGQWDYVECLRELVRRATTAEQRAESKCARIEELEVENARLRATTVPVEIVYGSHGDHDSWRLWVIDAQMERILLSAGVASTYAECVAKAKDWIGSQHKAKEAQG